MASDFRLKEQLPNVTARILASYSDSDRINHLGHCPLPKYQVVVSILDDLKDIIYPGFRRREGLHAGNVMYHVGDLVDTLHDKLTTQVGRALHHDDRVHNRASDCENQTDYEAKGQAIAIKFLEQLPGLRRMLATDVEAAYDGDPAVSSRDEVIFCYPGLEAITVYRIANALRRLGVPFIPRMMTEWAHKETGIDIHPGATIGEYFFIDHGTGVVIGDQSCSSHRNAVNPQGFFSQEQNSTRKLSHKPPSRPSITPANSTPEAPLPSSQNRPFGATRYPSWNAC